MRASFTVCRWVMWHHATTFSIQSSSWHVAPLDPLNLKIRLLWIARFRERCARRSLNYFKILLSLLILHTIRTVMPFLPKVRTEPREEQSRLALSCLVIFPIKAKSKHYFGHVAQVFPIIPSVSLPATNKFRRPRSSSKFGAITCFLFCHASQSSGKASLGSRRSTNNNRGARCGTPTVHRRQLIKTNNNNNNNHGKHSLLNRRLHFGNGECQGWYLDSGDLGRCAGIHARVGKGTSKSSSS